MFYSCIQAEGLYHYADENNRNGIHNVIPVVSVDIIRTKQTLIHLCIVSLSAESVSKNESAE